MIQPGTGGFRKSSNDKGIMKQRLLAKFVTED